MRLNKSSEKIAYLYKNGTQIVIFQRNAIPLKTKKSNYIISLYFLQAAIGLDCRQTSFEPMYKGYVDQ